MDFTFKYSIHFAVILTIVLLITNCSDDSTTSTDPGDVPDIPEATPAEINNAVFQENNPTGEEYAAFTEAGFFVETANSQLVASTSLSTVFLSFTESQQAEFNDGVWEWTFSYSEASESLIITTTAEELSNGTEWNVYISGNFNGETVDEFTYLTGFNANDQSSGNWQYFSPEFPGQPVLEYQWTSDGQGQSTFSTIFNNPDEDQESRVDYVRDGNDNTLEYTGFGAGAEVLIYLDSSSGTGYLDEEGEDRRCWDESFAETACS